MLLVSFTTQPTRSPVNGLRQSANSPAWASPAQAGVVISGALILWTGALWAAGGATRAAERGRAGYQSISREERRDLAAAALRGGYEIGAPVNFDAAPLLLDEIDLRALGRDCPIGWADDEVRVRWRPGAPLEGASTLEGFLRERAALLIDPPLGSG